MPRENRWEAFARANAERYIAGPEARRRFFESGRREAQWMLEQVAGLLPARDLAIEIGCGVGRLLIPMARHFARVIGVDVAPTMLAGARANCEAQGVDNIETDLVDSPWDEPGRADLVYCWLVLQHEPSLDEIERIVRRAAGALKTGGIGVFQFDTRPPSLGYRLRNAIPDPLLPPMWRRGIRRIRRAPGDLAAIFDHAALEIVREHGPGPEHVYVVRRSDEVTE